jgi:hypothetical protein
MHQVSDVDAEPGWLWLVRIGGEGRRDQCRPATSAAIPVPIVALFGRPINRLGIGDLLRSRCRGDGERQGRVDASVALPIFRAASTEIGRRSAKPPSISGQN